MTEKYSKEEVANILHIAIKAINDCMGEETKEFSLGDYDGMFDVTIDSKPEDSHKKWLKARLESGWVYGEVKDVANKISPCLLPYEDLPEIQKAKDYISLALVKNLYLNNKE